MNAILAIDGLSAKHPSQRARCAVTGRFIAWARVPALRLATSKGVVGRSVPAVSVSVPVSVPAVSAPVSVVPVSAPVSVSAVSVVRVVRASTVSAIRSVLFRVVRSGRSVVARVRSLFGRVGQALTRRAGRAGRAGRADIGGDM